MTVLGLMTSSAAISSLVRPAAASAAIWASVSLSAPRAGAAPAADPTELGARLGGPQRRAQPLERVQRPLERLARRALVVRAPLGRSEREQRAAVLERERQPLVALEAPRERAERAIEVAARRGEQARQRSAAASACGRRTAHARVR